MHIAPVAAPGATSTPAPVAPLGGGHPVPPRPSPVTDRDRMQRSVAFTKVIADELATFESYLARGADRDRAAQWVDFAARNFETIFRFAEATPAMVARNVPTIAYDHAIAGWQLTRDTLDGVPADALVTRARALSAAALELGALVQSILDAN